MPLQFGYRCSLLAFAVCLFKACLLKTDIVAGLQFALIMMMVYFAFGFAIGQLALWLVIESVDREMTLAIHLELTSHPPASS